MMLWPSGESELRSAVEAPVQTISNTAKLK